MLMTKDQNKQRLKLISGGKSKQDAYDIATGKKKETKKKPAKKKK